LRSSDGTPLLTEQPLTVVADPPNLYLEEGERRRVSLWAFLRGKRPGAPVSVAIMEADGPLPPLEVHTDNDGRATFPINAGNPGSRTWVLVPWRETPPTPPMSLDPGVSEYVTLRATPADDNVANLDPTWENVHQYVFRDWEALAPCMDNWLRLGDEGQCRRYASLIRSLTSRQRFDEYGYMPVTRDLTKGQRVLLHRWCDAVAETAIQAALVADGKPKKDPFGRGF